MACCGRFPSCCEEIDTDPKSGRDLAPDEPVCATSCSGDMTNPAFLRAFLRFLSLIP